MALTISSELHRALLAAAAASPDAEICGLLIGDTVIERIVPADNVAAHPSDSFEIDPTTLFAAIRAERAGEGNVLGYYHSHPEGPPIPSARDADQSVVDGRVWLIIGKGRAAAWLMTDTCKFNEIQLNIVG